MVSQIISTLAALTLTGVILELRAVAMELNLMLAAESTFLKEMSICTTYLKQEHDSTFCAEIIQ